MKTINEQGIVFGLLSETEQTELKEAATRKGAKTYVIEVDGSWDPIGSPSWYKARTYKVEYPEPKTVNWSKQDFLDYYLAGGKLKNQKHHHYSSIVYIDMDPANSSRFIETNEDTYSMEEVFHFFEHPLDGPFVKEVV